VIEKLIDRLIAYAKQTPYSHIGDYMERYWIVPYAYERKLRFVDRPFGWLLQKLGIAVRIHHILRSDDDRALHDHPWWYVSLILRGWYMEVTPVYDESGLYSHRDLKAYHPGALLFRRATAKHRLIIPTLDATDGTRRDQSCWTLFITGPYKQRWGFYPYLRTKIYWKEYVATDFISPEILK